MFEQVTLSFDGEEYRVKPDRVWGLIGAIERHTTFAGLARRMSQGDLPRTVISSALASALSYAADKHFSDEEVSSKLPTMDLVDQASALLTILQIAEPPASVVESEPSAPPKKKARKSRAS